MVFEPNGAHAKRRKTKRRKTKRRKTKRRKQNAERQNVDETKRRYIKTSQFDVLYVHQPNTIKGLVSRETCIN
jgi:hypothetical protein